MLGGIIANKAAIAADIARNMDDQERPKIAVACAPHVEDMHEEMINLIEATEKPLTNSQVLSCVQPARIELCRYCNAPVDMHNACSRECGGKSTVQSVNDSACSSHAPPRNQSGAKRQYCTDEMCYGQHHGQGNVGTIGSWGVQTNTGG